MPSLNGTESGGASQYSAIWRYVRILLVLGLLAALLYIAKPAELWQALKGAQWLWLLIAMPFGFAAIFFDALKLYLLILPHGYRAGWKSVFKTTLIVNFVSLFLPGTVGGGAVAWYRLSKPDGLRAEAFTAVSFNALVKLVVICGLGAAALSADVMASDVRRQVAIPLAILAAVTTLLFLLLTMTGFSVWFDRIIVSRLVPHLPQRIASPLRKIVASVEAYRGAKSSVAGALSAGVARKLIENFCFLLALKSVGVEAGYARVLWIMCAVEAFGMVPLTLSGWGLPQVTFVGLFALFGVPSDRSLASQVLSIVILLPVYLTGALLLLRETLSKDRPELPPKRPWKIDALCLILIIGCFLAASLDYINRPGELSPIDTAGYLQNARLIRDGGGPIGWLKACFTGKYPTVNQMPLYLLILSGFSFETVNVLAWAKLITLAIGATGILATYLIARELFGRAEAVAAASAMAVNSAWLQHSSMVASESLLAIFVTMTWFYLVLYWRTGKFGAQAGASAGLAFLTKATTVLMLPVLGLLAIAKERLRIFRSKQFWLGLLVFILVCLPILARNTIRFHSPFYTVTSAGSAVMTDDWSKAWEGAPAQSSLSAESVKSRLAKGIVQEGIYFIVAAGQTYLFNEWLGLKAWPFGLLVFMLALMTLFSKQGRDSALIALAMGVIFFFFFSWFIIKDMRFIVPVLPVILILAARGAKLVLDRFTRIFESIHPRLTPANLVIVAALVIAAISGASALAQPNVPGHPLRVPRLPPGYMELRDWLQISVGPETTWMIGLGQEYRYFWGDPLPGRQLPLPGVSFERLLEVIDRENVRYIVLDYSTVMGLPHVFEKHFEANYENLVPLNPPLDWQPVFQFPEDAPAYIIYKIAAPHDFK